MKKLVKIFVCLTLAAVLCFGMGMAAFAEDAQGSDSLDDLLSLLASLNSGDETEEDSNADGMYQLRNMTFAVPEGMQLLYGSEADDSYTFMSSDFSSVLTLSFTEAGEDENIDLHDEDNVAILTEIISENGEILGTDYTDIDGHTVLLIVYESTAGELTGVTENALVELENGIVSISYYSPAEDADVAFGDFLNNIYIGETQSGPAAPVDEPSKEAPVPVAAVGGEMVLIDDEICTVSLKSFSSEDSYYGYVVKVFIENKTDKNLYFTTDYVSMNDYILDCYWGETVSSGHKSNSEMNFYKDDMELNGITDVRSIAFTLSARDDDDWSNMLEQETFTIYPYGEDVPEQAPQEFEDNDLVLVDENGIRMILTGFDDTDDYSFKASVYLENNTDKNLRFSLGNATAVNGYEIGSYMYEYIPSGKKTNAYMTWYWDDLHENDIDTVEDLELDIDISDYDDFWADPVYEALVSVTVE
ncbi:MAG: hypothetical protein IJ106_05445 [Parasporobacterium sp.]|nr:hypothetical protein [Parasporobacterium sp.]